MPDIDAAIQANAVALLDLLQERIRGCECITDPQHNEQQKRLLCDRCEHEGELSARLFQLLNQYDPDAAWAAIEPWLTTRPALTLIHDSTRDR